MAAGGGGSGWIKQLVGGAGLIAAGMALHASHIGPAGVSAALLGVGGLLVVFGSCGALIKAVDGLAKRAKLNDFVAGTLAGLASNVPELVMLGFVLAAEPRLGFVVTTLTLHVGAAAFGLYCALLPRDESGHSALPEPMVKITTDLFACAAGVFFATGSVMVLVNVFKTGAHAGEALGIADLCVLGVALLAVQVVATLALIRRFSGGAEVAEPANGPTDARTAADAPSTPSRLAIGGYLVVGLGASVLGGHAVGDFADVLVAGLRAAGWSEMVGALVLSVFASAGAFAMVFTAHRRGLYDIALANASGQVSQVPFVVLPVAMLMLACFGATGVVPLTPSGGVLPIDLETTSVLLLSFPSMLILWKAIQDDGKVNALETVAMLSLFGVTIYFLAAHG